MMEGLERRQGDMPANRVCVLQHGRFDRVTV
jgi:hypothetical protein